MTQFTRPAPWLRQVQPYDGGGWPVEPTNQWAASFTTAAVAGADTTLLTNGANEIARLLAISFAVTAGVIPSVVVDISDGTVAVSISAFVVAAALGATNIGILLNTPILGPGHTLRGRHFGGDAATVVNWRVYAPKAPIGTVFYL